jgi:ABC-2 type transport system permease protein
MSAFLSGVRVILALELRQRVRGVAWYVLLGVFFLLVGLVTLLLTVALTGFGTAQPHGAGGAIFSIIIYFVLLLGTLVAPALSGNAINGDRDAGTLATTQVTLVTTWQLVLGKFFAAWITAIAFLAAALPFLIFTLFLGGIDPVAILVAVLVLAVELGVVAAIGVGLSGILNRPLFSIVLTYLAVAALSVGTLIAFALGGLVTQTTVNYSSSYASESDETGTTTKCTPEKEESTTVPDFSHYWGILAANPYVVLADAVPTSYDGNGNPQDLFGFIKLGVRTAQLPPATTFGEQGCTVGDVQSPSGPTSRDIIQSTVPGWFVGLLIHIVLAAGALTWAWGRTRTPARRLGTGRRIA